MKKIYQNIIMIYATLLIGSTSYAAPAPIGLDALTKGCLDSTKPNALAQCQKLCNDGFQFYCDAIKGAPQNVVEVPVVDPSGGCNISDDQLPVIEGVKPDEYAHTILLPGSKSKVNNLEIMCGKQNSLRACKVLCKIGCKQYCNYCEIGKAACAKGDKNCNFLNSYKFIEQSFVPDPNPEKVNEKEMRIIHNCNPATKKRGVGVIPGGDENYIGHGYGRFGFCKGYCTEEIMINYPYLRLAFEAGQLGSKEEYDGVPTWLEMVWLGGNKSRCDHFFTQWWDLSKIPGGTKENPLKPGDRLYEEFSNLVTLKPGVHAYDLPRWENGPERFLCGRKAWLDSTNHDAYQDGLKEQCRNDDNTACKTLCRRGAGYEEFCAIRDELNDVSSCKRYGGPHSYQSVPSCQKLCATGKPEYKQYCAHQ